MVIASGCFQTSWDYMFILVFSVPRVDVVEKSAKHNHLKNVPSFLLN